LASLLENAHVRYKTHFITIEDASRCIHLYIKWLLENRSYEENFVKSALTRVLKHKHDSIDLNNERTLWWPLRNLLKRVDYTFAFNSKYPHKNGFLETKKEKYLNLRIPGVRSVYYDELELKKSFFEKMLAANPVVRQWTLWTDQDVKNYYKEQEQQQASSSATTSQDGEASADNNDIQQLPMYSTGATMDEFLPSVASRNSQEAEVD
jgi:hypothetical protein